MAVDASTLGTDRLVLRPVRRADVPHVAVLANDEDVASWTASIPFPYSMADAEAWFAQQQAARPERCEWVFALERRSDGAFMGALGLTGGARGEPAEMGYWLGKPYWNRGYMTEAVRRILAFAFEEIGLQAVRAAAFPNNAASIRVQEKTGMRLVGREVRAAPARGGDREMEVREITRAAWRA